MLVGPKMPLCALTSVVHRVITAVTNGVTATARVGTQITPGTVNRHCIERVAVAWLEVPREDLVFVTGGFDIRNVDVVGVSFVFAMAGGLSEGLWLEPDIPQMRPLYKFECATFDGHLI